MFSFFSRRLERRTIESGSTPQLLKFFSGRKVSQDDLNTLWEIVQEPAGRDSVRRREGLTEAFLALLGALPQDEARARQSVVRILGRLGSADAIMALTAVLHGDTVSKIRQDAAEALGEIGGDIVLAPLVEACLGDDLLASIGAADALARLGVPEGIDAIRRKLCALADAGHLWGGATVQGTMFRIFPQYDRALQKVRSNSCVNDLIHLLKDIYAKDHYKKEIAQSLMFTVLAVGLDTNQDKELARTVDAEMPELKETLAYALRERERRSSRP